MGLLSIGTPLPWDEAKKHADHVRKHGIIQLSNIWRQIKTRRRDHLLWGDEVEYMCVEFDHDNKSVSLSLDAYDTLLKLEEIEAVARKESREIESSWKPEYGRYMLEGTPGSPYGSTLKHLLDVEPNMVERRQLAKKYLGSNQECFTLTSFPLLGSGNFLVGKVDKDALFPDISQSASRSLFIPDVAINPHARFS